MCHNILIIKPLEYSPFEIIDLNLFRIMAQVIIELHALSLVENYVISCYNHPALGDYNTEALISSWGLFDNIHFAFCE